jgi:hypothetical protein
MAYYNPNQPVINQLMRQKDNIDNLLNQYTQPQVPVQNIINTGVGPDFEARVLTEDEDVSNILISKRTMFLDKKHKKVLIKELDGSISEEYEIIIPLDEKDKKILELESKVKEMEVKINEYTKPTKPSNDIKQSVPNVNVITKPTTETVSREVQESVQRTTSSNDSQQV